jgi:hypothetical protein
MPTMDSRSAQLGLIFKLHIERMIVIKTTNGSETGTKRLFSPASPAITMTTKAHHEETSLQCFHGFIWT